MKGKILGSRYKIIDYLAEGGFGRTYLAEDTQLPGRDICLVKQLYPSRSDPRFMTIARRLFATEASTLHHLGHHQQIPKLLAYFEEEEKFYLVQQYIEGVTLTEELNSGLRWTELEAIAFLQDGLNVLQFVHEQRVIHRDIKPDNIIRCKSDGKLVLVDFGSVKEVLQEQQEQQTNIGELTIAVGTQGYMPTEQARGKPRPTSDIYALGMIAIQGLTGISPLDLPEDEEGEILWESAADISPELAEILTRMTRYHFKDRYKSAREVLQALDKLPNLTTKVQSFTNLQPASDISLDATASVSQIPKLTVLPTAIHTAEPIERNEASQQIANSDRQFDDTVINSQFIIRSPVKQSKSRIFSLAIAFLVVSLVGVGLYSLVQQPALEPEIDTIEERQESQPKEPTRRLPQGEGFRKNL